MRKLIKSNLKYFSNQVVKQTEVPKLDYYNIDFMAYKDLDQPVKYTTGFGTLEIEPFPRMKIMKICSHILNEIEIGIPDHAFYKVYTKEKMMWLMEQTHLNPNIPELEKILETFCVEDFLEGLAKEVELVKIMRDTRPWDEKVDEAAQLKFQTDTMTNEEYLRFQSTMTPTQKALLKNK